MMWYYFHFRYWLQWHENNLLMLWGMRTKMREDIHFGYVLYWYGLQLCMHTLGKKKQAAIFETLNKWGIWAFNFLKRLFDCFPFRTRFYLNSLIHRVINTGGCPETLFCLTDSLAHVVTIWTTEQWRVENLLMCKLPFVCLFRTMWHKWDFCLLSLPTTKEKNVSKEADSDLSKKGRVLFFSFLKTLRFILINLFQFLWALYDKTGSNNNHQQQCLQGKRGWGRRSKPDLEVIIFQSFLYLSFNF